MNKDNKWQNKWQWWFDICFGDEKDKKQRNDEIKVFRTIIQDIKRKNKIAKNKIKNMTQIRNSKPKLNKRKAKAVILYLLNKLGPLGEQKLKLLLYFLDMDFYEKEEQHFMGFSYVK